MDLGVFMLGVGAGAVFCAVCYIGITVWIAVRYAPEFVPSVSMFPEDIGEGATFMDEDGHMWRLANEGQVLTWERVTVQ
jgi:hypothetical protein